MQRAQACFRVRKTGSAKQSSIYSFPSGKMNGPPPCTLRGLVRIAAQRLSPALLTAENQGTQAFGAILN
jgi:hypothetical protein